MAEFLVVCAHGMKVVRYVEEAAFRAACVQQIIGGPGRATKAVAALFESKLLELDTPALAAHAVDAGWQVVLSCERATEVAGRPGVFIVS